MQRKRKTTEWERLEITSRKLRIIKGIFHAKMGSIKDRNGMDLFLKWKKRRVRQIA